MIGRIAAAVGLIGAGCVAYGAFVERQAFTLRRVTVPVLPAGQRPLTVLHISDVHLSTDRRNLVRWVDSLAGLRPDLVVTTGDNLSQPEALPMVYQAYARLFAFPGVFVFGSNDYFAPSPVNPLSYLGFARERQRHREILPHRELRAAFVERGWYDVEHQRVELTVDGRLVEVRGTKDAHLGLDMYGEVAGPPDPAAMLSIGVTHAPYLRLLDAMTADGVDLIMAGHTHGGQVCVPELRCADDELRPRHGAGQGAQLPHVRRPHLRAARLRRPRHQPVRAVPLRLPPGGHPADPRPACEPGVSQRP